MKNLKCSFITPTVNPNSSPWILVKMSMDVYMDVYQYTIPRSKESIPRSKESSIPRSKEKNNVSEIQLKSTVIVLFAVHEYAQLSWSWIGKRAPEGSICLWHPLTVPGRSQVPQTSIWVILWILIFI